MLKEVALAIEAVISDRVSSSVVHLERFGYERREGFRITMGKERIDVLAATIHLWCEITDETRMLLDWLFKEEYQILLENT